MFRFSSGPRPRDVRAQTRDKSRNEASRKIAPTQKQYFYFAGGLNCLILGMLAKKN